MIIFGCPVFYLFSHVVIFSVFQFSIYSVLWIRSTNLAHSCRVKITRNHTPADSYAQNSAENDHSAENSALGHTTDIYEKRLYVKIQLIL